LNEPTKYYIQHVLFIMMVAMLVSTSMIPATTVVMTSLLSLKR
jgi:hypothetical protein